MRKLSVSDMVMSSILIICVILTIVLMAFNVNRYNIKKRISEQPQPEQVYTDADILESRVTVADHDKRVAGISNQLSNCLTFDREQCYYNVYIERGFDLNDIVTNGGILQLSNRYNNNIQNHRNIAKKPLQIELGLGAETTK